MNRKKFEARIQIFYEAHTLFLLKGAINMLASGTEPMYLITPKAKRSNFCPKEHKIQLKQQQQQQYTFNYYIRYFQKTI